MKLSLSKYELKQYIKNQLDTFFPDKYKFMGKDTDVAVDLALDKTENCFKHIAIPHYYSEGKVKFNHLHSDQYSQFLYYLSSCLWEYSENRVLCDKIVCLNKLLNSVMITYKANLPDIFLLGHPVGSVLGQAEYSDFLVILQNVTVNEHKAFNNNKVKIGKGVCLSAGAKIIGSAEIGDRCSIGANVVLHNANIESDSTVFFDDGLKVKKSNKCFTQRYFIDDLNNL